MTLDISTRELLAKAAAAATKPRHLMTPQEARAAFADFGALFSAGSKMQDVRALTVPVQGGNLPARLFVPSAAPEALLVYFHGGGWIMGTLEIFDPVCRELAIGANVAVALVEYRKAPEHPFPVPSEDAWAATNWLAERTAQLVGENVPLLVGGDSAGANLAISVTLRARAQSSPRIAGQLLVYPVTDCRFDRPSYLDPANQLLVNVDTMKYYWSQYAPRESERLSALASPCREPDLSDLPPAVVVTAEHDVLKDEGEDYACRLREAGVAVDHKCFPGQMHGFFMMHGLLPGSREGVRFVCASLRNLLMRPSG